MPLTSSATVLLVRDVAAAADYYREKLGFTYDRLHGNFVILHREGGHVMLKQAADPKLVVPHWTVSKSLWNIYFWVTDVDALYAEFQQRGATIDYGIGDKPYGCREFGVRDLDGYDIAFGQPA